jgi:glycosyltransferase involved in cell wall biosynthesis
LCFARAKTRLRTLLHKPYKLFGKKIFRKADKIVCVSNYEKNLLTENFNICEEKIAVIPNGVDVSEFNSLKKPDNVPKTILCVARLEKYKGMKRAQQRSHLRDCRRWSL